MYVYIYKCMYVYIYTYITGPVVQRHVPLPSAARALRPIGSQKLKDICRMYVYMDKECRT